MARFALLLLIAVPASAADWPQWLGPTRDAVWSEEGIVESFPKEGLKVRWKKAIEAGYAGPAVAGGKLFVMDRKAAPAAEGTPKGVLPGTERVVCLDSATGEKKWVHEYDRNYQGVDRPLGPRTTPAVDGSRVYTLGSMGDLYCLDVATGKPVWSKYFPKDYNCKPPVWGYSAHLLVHDDLVIALVGGEGHAVVAFDKATGKEAWAALSTRDVGYSSPVIVKAGGVTQLIVWLSDSLNSLDPKTGKLHWKQAHPEAGVKQMTPAVTIATPAIIGDLVVVSSAYDGPLAVKLKEKGTAEIAWRAKDGYPKKPEKLATLMTTLLVQDQHLYGLDSNTAEVICCEAATGKELWRSDDLFQGKKALFGSAFWVKQGGRVFTLTDAGDLVLLKLSPEKYEEISRARVTEPIIADRGRKVVWSHPAFAEKAVFIRNQGEIVCYSLGKS